MKAVQISYNYSTDKTTVRLTPEFESLHLVHQLDSLKDAIYDLQEIYDAKLTEMHNRPRKEPA